jgi:hypothetical protein
MQHRRWSCPVAAEPLPPSLQTGRVAVHREFGLAEDEVPVMLLSIGAERPVNWAQEPLRPVADMLDLV